MNVEQAIEILRTTIGQAFSLEAWFVTTLVQALAQPAALVLIFWIFRKPLERVLQGISEFALEFLGAKVSARILDRVPDKLPQNSEQKVRDALATAAAGRVTITGTATPRFLKIEEAKTLRVSMGRDLEHLETLSNIAASAPVVAMTESWAILKRVIVQTADVHGYTPPKIDELQAGETETRDALFYLTTRVLNSNSVMESTYLLAATIQKVEKGPSSVPVSARDAQDFIKYCMAIIAELSLAVDKITEGK